MLLFSCITYVVLLNMRLNAPHTSTRIIPVDAKTKYVMDMAKLLVLVTLSGVPSRGIPSVFQQLINCCRKEMQHTWKSR